MGVADELGIPCVGEGALGAYPNLPESVHPGVVTGQALIDLLDHASTCDQLSSCCWGRGGRPPRYLWRGRVLMRAG